MMVPPNRDSHGILSQLEEKDALLHKIKDLFHTGWSGVRVPAIQAVFKITRSYRTPLRNDAPLLFSKVASTCALTEQVSLGTPKLCTLSECSLCTVIQSYFDVDRDSPAESSHRPFGAGIYVTSSSSWADRSAYATPWNGGALRALLVSRVIIGRPYKTQRVTRLTKPPSGFDSVVTVPGLDFAHEETVLYSNDSIRPAYLVIYGTVSTSISHSEESATGSLSTSGLPPSVTGQAHASTIFEPEKSDVKPSTLASAGPSKNSTLLKQPEHVNIPARVSTATSLSGANPALDTFHGIVLTRLTNRMRLNSAHLTPSQNKLRIEILQTTLSTPEGISPSSGHHGPQTYIDMLQQIMDDPYIWPVDEPTSTDGVIHAQIRGRLRRVLLKMSLDTGLLPSSLFLEGVKCPKMDAVGAGSFADVYRGTHDDGAVALKRLRSFQMTDEAKQASLKKAFYHEALLWKNLKHPHILPFLGVDNSNFKQSLCMVLPWMPEGNVRSMMVRLRETEKITDHALFFQAHRWLKEIVAGLVFLHGEDIVHADLRGPNVLIDADWGVRVADFGMALFGQASGSGYAGGGGRWTAPELIDSEEEDDSTPRPTFYSDIYSLGCVVVELYTCQDPFFGLTDYQVMTRVLLYGERPARPVFVDGKSMPDDLWPLICQCWEREPSQRPRAQEVLQQLNGILDAL